MGIEDFIPPKEDLKSSKVTEGIIIAVYPHSTSPVLVHLDGHKTRSMIPKYCFACSGDDLEEAEEGQIIRYYQWETKTGKRGEIVEVLNEVEIMRYEEGRDDDTVIFIDREFEQMIDEAAEEAERMQREQQD